MQRVAVRSPAGDPLLALALYVAAPGAHAMLITPTNGRGGYDFIGAAVRRDVCFAVDVAQDIIAIDGDNPENLQALRRVERRLRRYGVECVIEASGGQVKNSSEPRHHLFARLPSQGAREVLRALNQDLLVGLDWRRGINQKIRPPLTRHRSGTRSTLVSPTDIASAVRILKPRVQRSAISVRPDARVELRRVPDQRRGNRRALSARMVNLLVAGDLDGVYTSGSEVLQALATSMVNAGMTLEEFSQAAREPSHRGGEHYRRQEERRRGDGQRALERAWDTALDFVDANPGCCSPEASLLELLAHVSELPWSGRTSGTDMAVYNAHVQASVRSGCMVHALSQRDALLWAGIGSHHTLLRSRMRLAKARLLHPTGAPRPEAHAQQYRLVCWSDIAPFDSRPHTVEAIARSSMIDGAHDVWRHRAVGKSALRIARFIEYQEHSVAEISSQLHISPGWTRELLGRMDSSGMLSERGGRVSWAAPDLDLVAEGQRWEGRGVKQELQIARERARWAKHLAPSPIPRSGPGWPAKRRRRQPVRTPRIRATPEPDVAGRGSLPHTPKIKYGYGGGRRVGQSLPNAQGAAPGLPVGRRSRRLRPRTP